MPHILSRITAHQRALQGVLHCGLARGHRGTIASGLRLEKIYGAPVLLSGTAALVLSTPEISALHQHYKCTIKQLLKLPINTPESFAMLISGSLPLTALLHLGMLTLLGMISRLGPDNILHKIGRNSLLSAANSRSWFIQVRLITHKYGLADPLITLQRPQTKAQWKSSCRAAVTRWWLLQYRGEASHLDSMVNFKYNFFSLTKPHRTLTTANSCYEVQRACTVALMLSGQYSTDYHRRWWSPHNPQGHCRLCIAPRAPCFQILKSLIFGGFWEPNITMNFELQRRPKFLNVLASYLDFFSKSPAAEKLTLNQRCPFVMIVELTLKPRNC